MNQDIFNPTRVTATVGGKEIIFETGRLANQAHGAVWVQCGGTVVLVTVCSQALEFDKGFFPLTVEYSEKMYAAGRIPGSFFRREIGRPSERETLVSRLIDRPIRPLFPKGLNEDVQVLASVISADQENESDVLALTGASAAVMLSPLPFEGPVAGGRIGRIDGQFVLNPTFEEQERSDLNIVFAASRDALTMVEGEATFVPEDVIIDALEWGRKEIQPLIDAQLKLRELAGKEKMPFTPHQDDPVLVARVQELAREAGIEEALRVPEKLARKDARKAVKDVLNTGFEFFHMMGRQFATVITLIVAGELFAKGLIATGTIDYLIAGTQNLGLPAYAIMIVVVSFISISCVVMGSGNAPFFAFAPLVPDFAQQFGVSTILLLMPMQLSTGLARVMSPITAVVVAVAGCSGISPFALVRRTAIPMTGGLIVMVVMTIILN